VQPFGKYLVNGRHKRDDIQGVVQLLKQRSVKAVVFRSETKMVPGQACENYGPLHDAGIEVREFWVPAAFTPGGVDLMKSGNPCG
jgi:hypothetical protein